MADFSFKLFGLPLVSLRSGIENPSISLYDNAALDEMFGETKGTVNVTYDSIITYSAVWRAVNLIAGVISGLPFHVYRKDAAGNRIEIPDHKIKKLISYAPNEKMNDFIFRERIMNFLLLWGNAYCIIERDKTYQPSALHLVHPRDVEVIETETKVFYNISDGTKQKKYKSIDILHFAGYGDGIKGKDPVTVARESVKQGMILMQQSNKLYEKGYLDSRFITMPGFIPDQKRKTFIDSLRSAFFGMNNSGKVMVLEGGSELKSVGFNPENMQFLQSRKFNLSEVARWFGLPPHKLYDLERATFSNIEHQSIEFAQDSIMTWTVRLEREINRKLFTEEEAPNHYVKFSLDNIMRADAASRAALYSKATGGAGWMTIDEIRSLEDMNKRGGRADELLIPLNMAELDEYKEIQTGNGNTK